MDYDLAEIAVLSASMRDETGRSSATALEHLTPQDFSSADRQKIFEVMTNLAPKCNEVDLMIAEPTLSSEIAYLSQQYGGGQIERYVDYLIEHRNHRAIELAILKAQDLIQEGGTAEEVASAFTQSVAKALSKRKGQVSLKDAATQAQSDFYKIDAGGVSAIPTGFSKLDAHLQGGLKNGSLYVIAARPGIGKSALAIHLAIQAAQKGIRSSYASLEMTSVECAGRLLTSVSGVPRPTAQGSLSHADRQKIEQTVKALRGWPITFKDDNQATLEAFCAFLAQQRLEGELGLAVIDYLQLLTSPGFSSRHEEVSAISRTMKSQALSLDVPVIGLSQLNRNLEAQNRKPALSDLRESGSIEQDADCVMLLSKEKEVSPSKDIIRIHLAKNRNGATGYVLVEFDKALGRFSTHVPSRLNEESPVSPSEHSW